MDQTTRHQRRQTYIEERHDGDEGDWGRWDYSDHSDGYWRWRGRGRGGGWRDDDNSQCDPTTSTACVPSPTPDPTATYDTTYATNAAAPTTLPSPQYILPGHTNPVQAAAQSRKQSIGLISGIAGGAFLLIVLPSFLWWCVSRRTRRRQVVSHSKTNLNSPSRGTHTPEDSALTSQQQSDLESFQLHFVPEKTAFTSDQPSLQSESPQPRMHEEGPFSDYRLNSSSTPDLKSTHPSSMTALPTQLPVIPLPTRRDQRNGSSSPNPGNPVTSMPAVDSSQQSVNMPDTCDQHHRTARKKTTSISVPRRISTATSTPYDLEALSQKDPIADTSKAMSPAAKDFYVDMLELIDSPTPASRHIDPRTSTPSPSTPLPEDHPLGPTPFSIALASPVQRPSSAGPLSKKEQDGARSTTEGVSPRTSRETARRLVQNHPPPPPPPTIPPPAVPVDAEGRPVRRRASTVTSLTKGAQPTASSKSKGRRSRTSSTSSTKTQAILPTIPLPPDHAQRLQMLGLPNVPPLSPTVSECDSRPPSWSTENRDSIASTFSSGVPSAQAFGPAREEGKVVEVIIADAMAVTAAKKYY